MAKPKLNVVTAFTWLSNILDTQNLTASEQLILLHIVKFLNRNFWKATNLSNHMLAKAIGKDDRTVKKALDSLTLKGLLIQKEGEIHIGIDGAENYFSHRKANPEPDREPEPAPEPSNVRTLADFIN